MTEATTPQKATMRLTRSLNSYRICHFLFFAFAIGIVGGRAKAQTLTQSLLQESPAKLVLQARESGDIVRGAILFHQGNLSCAKCHQAASEKDRFAPDLSRLGKEVTDESIVESILEPSKDIKKEYQTKSVLTNDGRVFTGMILRQNDAGVVLREAANVDEPRSIVRSDIEEIVDGEVSIMPAGLVDELKDRKQFLDLLRYVFDVRERGPTEASPIQQASPTRELSTRLKGLVLIRELNCVGCHDSRAIETLPATHQGPDLKWSARWLNPDFLTEFIAAPHDVKPGTSMPALLGHLGAKEKADATKSIVHFLKSVQSTDELSEDLASESDSPQRGFELFHTVGCVACHSPRDELAKEQPLEDSVPLGDLARKYSLKSLVAFLEDPHQVRPTGRMPKMQLTHREAIDLSAFLLQDQASSSRTEDTPLWQVNAALAEQGKQWFTQLRCAECHSGVLENATRQSTKSLASLDLERGCLSATSGAWPDFQLSDSQVSDIQAAIGSDDGLDAKQTIDFTLASFRCDACHGRDNYGGVQPQRRKYFQTTNLNLGEQGRIPPTLSGVGAKLKREWMRSVLVHGRSVRPYMKTRMPQFGESNVGHLIDLFQTEDQLDETEFAQWKDQKEARKSGWKIAGRDGLNCTACHTFQYKLSDTMPAVDLTEMAERLKKDWFYQYMLAPQKFSPNTVMPSFWPNGQALRPDLEGNPSQQVEALWQYLLDGRQARAPSGVIREPLEIVVKDEARMLRRKYAEIGKRGIGIGYPGGVNLAYDAQQMRLATLWKGPFVDPGAAWYGQGSGNVRPLGRTIQLSKGPDLYDPATVEPPEERPATHQFKGYSLGEGRRPTLRYEFDSVAVEDFFTEFHDSSTASIQLCRTVRLTSKNRREGLRFRIADGQPIASETAGIYRIGDRLRVRVASGQTPTVDGQSVFIPLKLVADQATELTIEYLWE